MLPTRRGSSMVEQQIHKLQVMGSSPIPATWYDDSVSAARITKQKVARKLRTQGKSLNEIARRINVAKSNVSLWVQNTPLTRTAQHRLAERIRKGSAKGRQIMQKRWVQYRLQHPKPLPNLNRLHVGEFFDTWNPESAYVLGFFAADGCMYHSRNGGHSTGGLYITFGSADLQLIEIIKRIMGINNKIETQDRSSKGYQPKHSLRIVNEKAYKRLLSLGFTPAKSLTLQFPDVPDSVLSHFFRGYFDGDGCVHFAKYRRRGSNKINYRHIFSVRFTSGSRDFLASLQQRLVKTANIGHGSLHPHGPNWELSYATHDSRQLYQFMYPTPTVPCLQRKKVIFERAITELGK